MQVNFAKQNTDTLTLVTELPGLPSNYSPANKPISIQVAGMRVDATLDGKGTYHDATHYIQVKSMHGNVVVELKVKKANIKSTLAVAANANLGEVLKGIGMQVSVGPDTYIGSVDLVYVSVKQGKATLKK